MSNNQHVRYLYTEKDLNKLPYANWSGERRNIRTTIFDKNAVIVTIKWVNSATADVKSRSFSLLFLAGQNAVLSGDLDTLFLIHDLKTKWPFQNTFED